MVKPGKGRHSIGCRVAQLRQAARIERPEVGDTGRRPKRRSDMHICKRRGFFPRHGA